MDRITYKGEKATMYEIVKDEINKWDGEQCIQMGMPHDTYLIEISDIMGEIRHNNITDERVLAKTIRDVFHYYFGHIDYSKKTKVSGYTIDNCLPVARRILVRLKESELCKA